jgi:hypothetical protein
MGKSRTISWAIRSRPDLEFVHRNLSLTHRSLLIRLSQLALAANSSTMFNAIHRYLARRWRSFISTISRFIGTTRYTTSTCADAESPAVTLDQELLRSIRQFDCCLEEGQSSTLGPFINLFVIYENGETGVVQCPQSFFKRSEYIREELRGILTNDQWKRMDAPISNYRIFETIDIEKGMTSNLYISGH